MSHRLVPRSHKRSVILSLCVFFGFGFGLGVGCDEEASEPAGHHQTMMSSGERTDDSPAIEIRPLELHLSATFGTDAVSCGAVYTGLGSSGVTARLKDSRVYLSEIHLVDDGGDLIPLTLDETPWQSQRVALLDFEDGILHATNHHSCTSLRVEWT